MAGGVPKGHGENVLVVEDEAEILRLVRSMLEGIGYTVRTAGSPKETLKIIKKSGKKIDILITYVIMPEINGASLSAEVTKHIPGIRTLYMSGYTASAITNHGILEVAFIFCINRFRSLLWR